MAKPMIEKIKKKQNIHFRYLGVEFYQQDPFYEEDISLKGISRAVLDNLPRAFFKNLDSVYVGQYDFLKKRKLDAAFQDGGIFVSNEKFSEEDVCDDIVHEIAHLVEEEYSEIIYGDDLIEIEFINKRKQLYTILNSEGYNIDYEQFMESEYNELLDSFLYQVVGYPTLSSLTVNLFCSPYGATSLREYFANCFEYFFWDKDITRVKKISPRVYQKLNQLLSLEEKE